jgi:hypothetical protein
MLVYGPLDPLAMIRHDQIVVGQQRWLAYDLEALDFFFRILFRSFWGMFGWMGVVLDDGFYILYLVLTVLGIAGVVVGRARGNAPTLRPTHHAYLDPCWARISAANIPRCPGTLRTTAQPAGPTSPYPPGPLRHKDLLGWAALLVFGEVAYYNLTFIQPQGRYLFPALVPIALFLSTGWWQLARRATSGPVVRVLTAGVLAGAIGWGFGEAHGALRATELWSDNALIAAAAVGAALVLLAPRRLRTRLPDGLCLVLALTLALLDLAALVKFVVPAFPFR